MNAQLTLFLAAVVTCWFLIREIPAPNQRTARLVLLLFTLAALVLSLAGVHGHFGR
jgi:hypothetical protein